MLENDAQHVTLASQLDMTEGVDPTPERHQPPVGQPVVDGISPEAETYELPTRYNAVLATRQRLDLQLDRTLTAHMAV
jgi:hypothetical protein